MTAVPSSIGTLRRIFLALAFALFEACSLPNRVGTNHLDRTPPILRWLGNDARLAEAAGAERASMIIAEAGAVGDRFTKVVDIDDSSCLLIMARSSERIADIDLYAYAEDGVLIAVDDRPDASPALLICPPHPRHIYVTARIAIGQGVLAVGVQRVPVDKAHRVRMAMHLAAHPVASEAINAIQPDADERLVAHHKVLRGQWTAIAQSTLAVDYRIPTVLGLAIDPGTCVDVLVLTPTTLSGLDVELLDESGRTVGRSVEAEQDESIVACAENRRNVALQFRPHDGIGTVLVLVSRGSLGSGRAVEQALELTEGVDLEQLAKRVHDENRAMRAEPPQVVARMALVRGQQQRITTRIESGCVRFDVFAGAPSLGVHVRAYSADDELLSNNGGAQYFPLVACARGLVTLVVEAQIRGGPVTVEKYPEALPSAVASSHPRAIARLFQKAWHLGLVKSLAEFDVIETIALRDKKQWDRNVSVNVGKCVDAFVSLDGDSAGVSLNWTDSNSAEVVDGEQHPDSAHVQLCCGLGSSTCAFRVVAEFSGTTQRALFATRHRR